MMFSTFIITVVATFTPRASLQSQAHTFLMEESWQEAADALDMLAEETENAEIMYDRGVAYYNLEDFTTAASAFDNAMASSDDETLRTHSAFNYGNAVFQKTIQELEGTGTASSTDEAIIALERAKEQIINALQSYRAAITEDHADLDARANGEFAWQMLKQLDQMQEQMEEEQKQQEQQQQQEDQEQQQDEESADEQQEKQENKEEGESEQEQQQDGEESEEQKDGEQSDDQQKQDGEQSEEQQQQDGEQSDEQQQQDGEQSKEQQQQDGEQSDEPQEQDGEQSDEPQEQDNEHSEEQDLSEGELETTEQEQQEQATESEVPQPSEKEAGKRLSKDEANRILQLIRDKEQQRRRALAAKRAAKRVPVEKDW